MHSTVLKSSIYPLLFLSALRPFVSSAPYPDPSDVEARHIKWAKIKVNEYPTDDWYCSLIPSSSYCYYTSTDIEGGNRPTKSHMPRPDSAAACIPFFENTTSIYINPGTFWKPAVPIFARKTVFPYGPYGPEVSCSRPVGEMMNLTTDGQCIHLSRNLSSWIHFWPGAEDLRVDNRTSWDKDSEYFAEEHFDERGRKWKQVHDEQPYFRIAAIGFRSMDDFFSTGLEELPALLFEYKSPDSTETNDVHM